MNPSEELANVIEKMVDEMVDEKLKILEETYFAKSKQTSFTKAELADKWGCSVPTVNRIIKNAKLKPCGKSGKELLFDIDLAQEAKHFHDVKELRKHEISVKARAK